MIRDEVDPRNDHIIALGFFVNSCPIRGILETEEQFMSAVLPEVIAEVEHFSGSKGFLVFIFCGLITVAALIGVYLCLKNRGKICKKQGQPSELVDQNSINLS